MRTYYCPGAGKIKGQRLTIMDRIRMRRRRKRPNPIWG